MRPRQRGFQLGSYFGQTSQGPFFKHNHGCTTYRGVDYRKIAADEADVINRKYVAAQAAIQAAEASIGSVDLAQAGPLKAELFTVKSEMDNLKQRILGEEPRASFNCPDPGYYTSFSSQFDNFASRAEQLKQKVTAAAGSAKTVTSTSKGVPSNVAQLQSELEKLRRGQQMAREGGATIGTNKTKKELLAPGEKQVAFMRSTNKPGANVHWKSWERLKTLIPANFNEQKYLANNPDVAAAVKAGVMPSGAYHYAMYGMGPGCHVSTDPSGKGKCDPSPRSFQGYRRPGFLAGIFSMWDQAD